MKPREFFINMPDELFDMWLDPNHMKQKNVTVAESSLIFGHFHYKHPNGKLYPDRSTIGEVEVISIS